MAAGTQDMNPLPRVGWVGFPCPICVGVGQGAKSPFLFWDLLLLWCLPTWLDLLCIGSWAKGVLLPACLLLPKFLLYIPNVKGKGLVLMLGMEVARESWLPAGTNVPFPLTTVTAATHPPTPTPYCTALTRRDIFLLWHIPWFWFPWQIFQKRNIKSYRVSLRRLMEVKQITLPSNENIPTDWREGLCVYIWKKPRYTSCNSGHAERMWSVMEKRMLDIHSVYTPSTSGPLESNSLRSIWLKKETLPEGLTITPLINGPG